MISVAERAHVQLVHIPDRAAGPQRQDGKSPETEVSLPKDYTDDDKRDAFRGMLKDGSFHHANNHRQMTQRNRIHSSAAQEEFV
jgi:hypothetical protein